MIPTVRTRLTPCRRLTRYVPFVPFTGRLCTANATASPCCNGTTSTRLCIRGRCSDRTNSPPVQFRQRVFKHAAPCGHDCESALPEDREPQPDGIHPGTEVFRSPRSPDCSTLQKSSPSHTSQPGHYPVAQKIPVPSAAGCSCRRLRFFLDDDLLALRAPAVAGKGAITSDHAMTRDRQGNCVGRAGVRDST